MSILTFGLVVLLRQVGAPFSLKVEHVKVWLLWVLVNESCFQIDLTVSEGAKVTIGTVLQGARTKLSLVLFTMVQAFDIAMCHIAAITFLADLFLLVLAQIRRVH